MATALTCGSAFTCLGMLVIGLPTCRRGGGPWRLATAAWRHQRHRATMSACISGHVVVVVAWVSRWGWWWWWWWGVNFPDVGHGCHEHLLGGLCSQVACIQYWWSLLDDRLPVPRPPAQRSHDLDLRAVLAPSSEARACCAAVDCNRAEEKKLCRASAFGAGGPQGGPWRLGGHASPLPAWSCARPCGFL